MIYVSLSDFPEVDLGKQMVDVTSLLPLTLEELEDPEKRSGKWSTSFRLSGKGKGASLNVSFGFLLIDESTVVDTSNLKMHDDGSVGMGSNKGGRWARFQSVEDVRVLHEILPSLKSNASSLADTVDNLEIGICEVMEMCDLQVGTKPESDSLCEEDEVIKPKPQALADHVDGRCLKEPEFVMIEQGVKISAKDQVSAPVFDKIDFEGLDQGNQVVSKEVEENFCDSCDYKERRLLHDDNQATMDDRDLVSDVLSFSEPKGLKTLNFETMTPFPKSLTEVKSDYVDGTVQSNSFSFDDSTESIAIEFLGMLGIDHSPFGLSSESDVDSPRQRLWKQFEEETLGAGSLLFGVDAILEDDDELSKEHSLLYESEDFDLSPMVHEAERVLHEATQGLCHHSRAKLLENAEIEALMRKWGLNEKAFQCSPPECNIGFGSPIGLSSEVPLKLPPLGEGLGPFVQTKDGGFLRSMSPALFMNSKCNASLIMQVSSPVVVPTAMGSGVMEILRCLASVGIEKLSSQAKKLMPLEDVTGKTIQHIAWETTSAVDSCKRPEDLPYLNREADAVISQKASGRRKKKRILDFASSSASDRDSEFVSVEDLAPLAMDKIEALSIEGLRIQSGMSDEEPPSNISSQFIGNMSALEGKGSNDDSLLGLEGTAGLQLLDVKGNADDVDGLMSLSITLDEWMRLDSGIVVDEDQTSDRTSKILAAHRAASSNLIAGGWKQEKNGGKRSGRIWGLLGSNLTVALMVQLRDPLRNYDSVGTPMLALVQVERVFVPPKSIIYTTVSEKGNREEDETKPEPEIKSEPILVNGEKKAEEAIPQFKITEVHVAGLNIEPNKKNIWGNSVHQQSGSRWLIANGMGKSIKHPFLKSKPVSKPSLATTTVHSGNALWSISSQVHGTGSKWKEMLAIHPRFRNPDVNFPEAVRLR